MDASVVLTLIQTLVQLLDSPTLESILGYRTQLKKLKTTMSTVRAVLLDAEQQQRQQLQLTNTLQDKLQRLKEAVYRADDLFDEVATISQHKTLMSGNRVSKEVRLFFSHFNPLRSSFTLRREIKNIRQIMDDIAKDHHDFGLSTQLVGLQVKNISRETSSYICEEDVIIGRDADKRIVIDMLVDTHVEKDVCIISIVGIGGLGKTTLAKLVYNDDTIQKAFILKMWVCVSDDLNVKSLLGEILRAATSMGVEGDLNLDQLQMKLRQALEGKKYLLVLDDVWKEDVNEWLKLANSLIGGGRGSRIVVTTRSRVVAKIVGSHKIHGLEGLSKLDSWNLFERMTLEPGQHQMEAHLVDIGKEIVRKCAGVPLAIRVIGSLLQGVGESMWQYIKNIDLANRKQDDHQINSILPVLKISYFYLPVHLKICFSYCAVFPKDYKIIKEDLICLWMAQGFIVPLDDRESFEDAGEDYFMNLLQRCFFQDVDRDDNGDIKSCKMHDLIHDVAREVAGTDIYSARCFSEKTQHFFFDYSEETTTLGHQLTKMKRLRTFIQPFKYNKCEMKGLLELRYLRVLDISRALLKELPSMISQQMHLRYLDLSENFNLVVLHTSITQLYNLQTLKLRSCYKLKELPRELSNLINLRHLDVHGCPRLTHMPPGLDCMTKLHKLTRFVLGETSICYGSSGADVADIRDLKELNDLKGSMEIKVQRGCTYDTTEVREGGYLINKPHLLEINIYWYLEPNEYKHIDEISDAGNNSEALMQGLQPHSNLRKLRLYFYLGVRFPSWGGSSMNLESCLPNLVKIVLENCTRLEHLPLMSQLRHLKVLELTRLLEVEYVESSDIRGEGDCTTLKRSRQVFFPSLEKLELYGLLKLKGWWKSSSHINVESGEGETEMENGDDIVNNNNEEQQQQKQLSTAQMYNLYSFPQLSCLDISWCHELTTFPLCEKLETLTLDGFDEALGPRMRGSSIDLSSSQRQQVEEEG